MTQNGSFTLLPHPAYKPDEASKIRIIRRSVLLHRCRSCWMTVLSADLAWSWHRRTTSRWIRHPMPAGLRGYWRSGRMVRRAWFVLPPAQAYYYRNFHIDYQPLPPLKPGCEEVQSRQMAILYPEHHSILYLPKGFSHTPEKVVLKATHIKADATIFWHLDDIYIGKTKHQHQLACFIEPGNHILTLIDDNGNQRSILFEVKE